MDTVQRNKDGYNALKPYLALADSIQNDEQLAITFAKLQEIGTAPFFALGRDADAGNSSQTIASLWQSGIGLPDRDYYFNDDPFITKIRDGYKTMLTNFANMIGMDNAEQRVDAVYELEKTIAEKMYTRKQNRDPKATYNKVDYEGLKNTVKGFDWDAFFNAAGVHPEEINLTQIGYFEQMGQLIANADKATISDYIRLMIIKSKASFLSDDFVQVSFDYYGKILSGTEQQRPLWKRVLGSVNNELLGQLFVEKYFPAAAKERMIELIENLRTAFAQRIDNLTWMGDSTKIQAKEKLAAITIKVGYPNKWEDYSEMNIDRELGYIGNIINVSKFSHKKELEKIGKPVDKDEWYMTPQTVNAYYNPSANEIVFPAGILQPPFFYANGDDAVNYGAIGVVIGHEMTHGFDDQGCQFDKIGNLKNWWTDEDSERFKKATQKLAERYSSFIAVDTLHANGELTLGENIADLGGLNIAHQAFINSLHGNEPATIDGQTADQRFCYAYSRIWASNISNETLYQQVKTDPHSPARLRVNVPLPLVDFFYKAFNITDSAEMYVPENERIVIW